MTAFAAPVATWFLNYLANAFWQAPLLFVVAWLMAHTARRIGPLAEHRLWVSTLFAEVTLPALNLPIARVAARVLTPLTQRLLNLWAHLWSHSAAPATASVTVSSGASYALHAVGFPARPLFAVMIVCLLLIAYFTLRLGVRLYRTAALLRRAQPLVLTLPGWQRLSRHFGVGDATIANSPDVSGPVTLGILRRRLMVPPDFTTLPAEDQDAALAHECAHMQRRDFALNLAYEVLSLPLAWNPLRSRTLAHIAETREMVCDALAAEAVAGREHYARSLLRLASALLAAQPAITHHAIGIFDANTLERRIMSLKQNRPTILRGYQHAIAAAAVLIACTTCASAVALRVHVAFPAADAAATPATASVTLQPSAATAPQDDPQRVSAGVMAGNLTKRVNPTYPEEAKAQHISGSVVLHATINKAGVIERLEAVSGPKELYGSALDAVRQWTYKPYLVNGEPVEIETTITVNYSLADN